MNWRPDLCQIGRMDEAEVPPPKRIQTEAGPGEKRIWCPNWDIREDDSLFQIGENGRCVNMSAFEAFRLRKDCPRLEKTDVEESYGAAMGHMARGLAYLAQNVHQIEYLLEDYRKLEDMAEKSAKCSEDLTAQRDRMCEEKHNVEQEAIELRKEVRRLANENKARAKRKRERELVEKLRKPKMKRSLNSRKGRNFVRRLNKSRWTSGVMAIKPASLLRKTKGDTSVLQLADYAAYVADSANAPEVLVIADRTEEVGEPKVAEVEGGAGGGSAVNEA